MDSMTAYSIAEAAVKSLAAERGDDATFPFDAIWSYAAEDVQSTLRPGQAKRLEKNGFIERTGRFTAAETPDRAGSPTTEYRVGSKLRPAPEAPVAATREGVADYAGLLRQLAEAMEKEGFLIGVDQLADFYLALRTTPLVILAGFSGTGKSALPRLFARLTGAAFLPVSVQPQWSDNTDLLGYTPTLNDTNFIPGRLTQAIEAAAAKPETLSVVLLDEMNLAPVEHYFSDFLSIVETRRRDGKTVLTDVLPLALPSKATPDPYAALRELRLSPSLRVVGTANMDETTRPFSPKVLDRAFTVEFENIDLAAFPTGGKTAEPALEALSQRIADSSRPINVMEALEAHGSLFEWAAAQLIEVREFLAPAGIEFGYRTRDAVCLYLANWADDDLETVLAKDVAFDLCLLHKVLPKVAGTGEALQTALESLHEWLHSAGYTHSAKKVDRMAKRLVIDGAVSYWTA